MTKQVRQLLDEETKERILFRIHRAEEFTKPWHENIARWRDLYNLRHYKKSAKPGEYQYSDPTITNTVDLAVGIFLANEFIWKATGWTPNYAEQRDSSSVEKFLAGTVEASSDVNEYDIYYETLLNFVRDGGAVLFSYWDTDVPKETVTLPDMEQGTVKRTVYTRSPIRIEVIDPVKVYFYPGNDRRWSAVVREESMSIASVEDMYGIEISDYRAYTRQQKEDISGTLCDYWEAVKVLNPKTKELATVVRNAVLFDGKFVVGLREMTGYQDLPYTASFYNPTTRDIANGWHSIITPLEGTISELERAINRRQFQIDRYSALPMVSRTTGNRPVKLDPGLGEIVNLNIGEDLSFPEWRGTPPDVREQIAFLSGRVQQSGFPDLMFGSGVSSSGYALSQMGDQGRIRLEQPLAHLEKLFTWTARKVINLVTHFMRDNEAIMTYGHLRGVDFTDMVTKDNLKGFNILCEIHPEFPNERIRDHAMASQVRGVLSTHTIQERYLGIQQPSDERKRMLMEMAQQSPILMNYSIISELQEMAELGDKAAISVLQMMQQSGLPGEPGRPKELPNESQPVGLQSSTGDASMSAKGMPFVGQTEADAMQNMATAAPNMLGGVG